MRDQGLALWAVTRQPGALSYRAAMSSLPSSLIRRSSSFSPGRCSPRKHNDSCRSDRVVPQDRHFRPLWSTVFHTIGGLLLSICCGYVEDFFLSTSLEDIQQIGSSHW